MAGAKLKIACIAGTCYPCNPDVYGSEVQLALLANELGKLGHEVTLYAATKSIKGKYRLRLLPCSWGRLSYSIENLITLYLDELLEHDYVIDGSPLCMFCEQIWFWHRDWLRNHVLVYYRNGTHSFNPRPPVNYNIHGVWLSNSAVEAMQPFKLPRELCHVIHYGINLDWYRPGNAKEDYILYLGAPRREKGIFSILEVARLLPDQRFVFAWKAFSEEHKRIEQEWLTKAKDLPNVEHVEYETLKEKVKLLQRAKCFIQLIEPDYVEAFGLAISEALACGTPVILMNRPCHKELFSGIAYFVGSVEEAAKLIQRDEWPTPEQCHSFIKERYSLRRYAESFLKLYESLAK